MLRPYASIPFIPGVSQQLQRAFAQAGCNLFHKSGQTLQNILCSRNKTQPPPCKCKGIYKFNCQCKPESVYIGETRRSVDLRAKEHQRAAETGKWSHSGLTQHRQNCNAPIDWEPEILSRVSIKDPDRLKYHLRVSEALHIKREKCGPGKGLNEDYGSYVKTDAWAPVFEKM